MKQLHRPDLFSWSQFDTARNVDFHGYLWVRPAAGSVAFDPMPLTDHDQRHIESLGGVAWVYLSNADHVRAAAWFRDHFHARIAAPAGDRHLPEFAGLAVDLWLEPGVTLDDGVRCLDMQGSKTPGELAFLLPGGDTVVCGDLVRGQRAGHLNLLPDAKLRDKSAAVASVRTLAALPQLDAVLVGDGWPVFRGGRQVLAELLASLTP
jgi:glyoxylase-like metal-dependent hydrolase (beta-lactamase superfamily II)